MTDTALRPPQSIRSRLGRVSYTYNLMAGQRVVEEGEDGLPLFVVTAGALAVSITSNGERVIVGILGPGDVFGDTRLVPDAPPHPEVRSLIRSRLLAVPPGALSRLLDVDESVRGWLLYTLLRRVRTFEHHLAALLPRAVAGRVEVVLADLAERFGRPVAGGTLVRLSLTQGAMAAMVGASRETVNRAMKHLVRQGRIIQSGRRYVIPSAE